MTTVIILKSRRTILTFFVTLRKRLTGQDLTFCLILGKKRIHNFICYFCFFLETSKVDYVLFEAAGLLKDGLIREWASLSNDEVKGLRSYLLSYVINHPTLSSYIRERIVQVVAIAIKRQSVDDLGEDRRQVRIGAKIFFEIVITEL